MIRILNEDNNSIENMTDTEIQELYDGQKSRISDMVQHISENIETELSRRFKDIVNCTLQEYISRVYFNKDDFVIVSKSDDFEDRMLEIKYIKNLQKVDDSLIEYNIKNIIKEMLFEE